MTPKTVLDRIEIVVGTAGPPRPLRSLIEAELSEHFAVAALEASERADRFCPMVIKLIIERESNAEQAGLLAVVTLVGSTSDAVAGICHVLASDTPELAQAKAQRGNANALLAAMRALTFNEFERFGAKVLTLLGAEFAKITPHGGDQGIDFFGHLSLAKLHGRPLPFMQMSHEIGLTLVGQAKHYPERSLGPDVVREVVGAVTLARSKTFSRDGLDLFDEANLKPFAPVATLLFTTGAITAGARRLAEAAGVVARSGDQLAVFLADHAVGMVNVGGIPIFDTATFAAWVLK